jgi:type IV secretory pathway VirB10-like protein
MFPNRLALPVLAVACVTAAAAGGYFAARQNAVPTPAAAQSQPADFAAGSTSAAKPVQETEALVGDTAKPSAAPAAPTPPSAPAAAVAPASPARTKPSRRSEAPVASNRSPASVPARQERTTAARQDPPPLSSSWPSNSGSSSPAQSSTADANAAATRTDERTQDPPRAPEPPQKTFEELVVSANSVLGLTTETRLSSDTAKIEDRVDAKVSRDVRVGDRVAIPAGSKAEGSVILVERGGKFKDRARLGIRFHTLVLADGTRMPINTEAIYREGDSPGNSSAAKVGGGAVGGAILGAILGGAKGAAIGAAAGGGGGTAAVMASAPSTVTIPAGTPLTARITSPVTVTTEKE